MSLSCVLTLLLITYVVCDMETLTVFCAIYV